MEDRAAAHEQEAFVEDVGEGVGASPVDGQVGADPDPGHHVTDLADDVIGEQPARIVLEHGIHHPVKRHHHTERHQDLKAGEPAAQGVYGGLGGERAEEHRPIERGFAVGVGKPGVQRRHRRVQEKPGQDQPGGRRHLFYLEGNKSQAAGRLQVKHNAG